MTNKQYPTFSPHLFGTIGLEWVEDGFGKVQVVEEEWGLCGEASEGELLFVVGGGGVEGGGGVVAGDAVFGDEGGYVGVGVAVEEAVVAYAEADDDIEVGVGLIQETGLEDGVAHCGTYLLAFCRDAHGGLCTAFDLADYGIWLEAVGPKDAGKYTSLIDEAYAVGDAYLTGTYATGEFHDFLHTGPLTVAFIFDFGTCYHYIVVAIFVIAFRCPERIFFREVRGQAEIRVCPCLELAVLSAAIYAA